MHEWYFEKKCKANLNQKRFLQFQKIDHNNKVFRCVIYTFSHSLEWVTLAYPSLTFLGKGKSLTSKLNIIGLLVNQAIRRSKLRVNSFKRYGRDWKDKKRCRDWMTLHSMVQSNLIKFILLLSKTCKLTIYDRNLHVKIS